MDNSVLALHDIQCGVKLEAQMPCRRFVAPRPLRGADVAAKSGPHPGSTASGNI